MPPRKNPRPEGRRFAVGDPSLVDAGVLETFPYAYPSRSILVTISTEEFTSVCPWSGLPDFATVRIEYIPRRNILELRSLKYYLHSYRGVGIYQEHLVNRIMEDLVRRVDPRRMKVTLDYRVRGGIRTVAEREYTRRRS
ncbi:MAG: preQ(1) synthase [Bacteroidota bacterium]